MTTTNNGPEHSAPTTPADGAPGFDDEFLAMLVCPIGKTPLGVDGAVLVCRCGTRFAINAGGIPDFVIDAATLPPAVATPDDLPCRRPA